MHSGSWLDFPRRSPADLLGTTLSGSVTIDGFETGKSDVSAINGETLTAAANTIMTFLLKYPASTVRLIGHADAVGREEANQALGQNRADSVQAFLVKAGIPVEAIRTESRGQRRVGSGSGHRDDRKECPPSLNAPGVLVAADEGATMAEWSGPGREWRVAASGAAVAPNDGNAQKPSL